MLDVPVGALYRTGHVVYCDLFGTRAMERPAHLGLREIRAQERHEILAVVMETSRNFWCQQAATGPVAKSVRVIPVCRHSPFPLLLVVMAMGRGRRSKVAAQRDNVDEDEEIEIFIACLYEGKVYSLCIKNKVTLCCGRLISRLRVPIEIIITPFKTTQFRN